ncbi:MAG TPA: DUF721 domain-containing protein [Steroidobacter sp.]|jgi:hypothetical protein|nr:DUF721 domain-containing protein [Steroidobacteraceae bacterium]HLS81902.1 DUF721 domain-containing protein [Steroidobacter sp.]
MSDRLRPLGEALGPLLRKLEERVQAHQELAAGVRAALPAPEKNHVLSAGRRDATLIVSVDSAAWASRLRYLQENLLEGLRAQGVTEFTKVKVRVGRRGGSG